MLPVKIAILDTGLQLPETARHFYKPGRIKDCRSWLAPNVSSHGHPSADPVDMDGHGTHAAGLILDVCEDAELYIGRIFVHRSEEQDASTADAVGERIAKVCAVQ